MTSLDPEAYRAVSRLLTGNREAYRWIGGRAVGGRREGFPLPGIERDKKKGDLHARTRAATRASAPVVNNYVYLWVVSPALSWNELFPR